MDQAGALAGPLLFAYMLIYYDYSRAFLTLLIPGTLVMIFVFVAWSLYPKIKMCKQLDIRYLIADDREARRVSKVLNITPIGTCGIIIKAYKRVVITRNEVIQILDELLKSGFRIGSELYCRILSELEPRC